jgi:hypothetical protein
MLAADLELVLRLPSDDDVRLENELAAGRDPATLRPRASVWHDAE